MKKSRLAALLAALGIGAFVVFIALSQTSAIVVPVFTPTTIKMVGLEPFYSINGSIAYSIIVDGYGSNCHLVKVTTFREDSSGEDNSASQQKEQVGYYYKADDCRYMDIVHGPYNVTRSLNYSGSTVLGEPGRYYIDIFFEDLVNHNKATLTKGFIVE